MHSIAVCNSGEVYAWGAGEYGQLGNGLRYDKLSPERVRFSEDLKIQKVAAGKHHTMILTDQGYLYACGEDNMGQLGLLRKKKIVEIPTMLSYMTHKNVIDVSCGTFHTTILIEPYYVFTTGNNKYGQLGLGDHIQDKNIFTFVRQLAHKNVINIFSGDHHSWFLLDHDDPYIDDYEIPEPWRFSERSIEDDNDFKEKNIGKKKKRKNNKIKMNEFSDSNKWLKPVEKKSKKNLLKLELNDNDEFDQNPKSGSMKPSGRNPLIMTKENQGDKYIPSYEIHDEERNYSDENSQEETNWNDLKEDNEFDIEEENLITPVKLPNDKFNMNQNNMMNEQLNNTLGTGNSLKMSSHKNSKLNMMGSVDQENPNKIFSQNQSMNTYSKSMKPPSSRDQTNISHNNSMGIDNQSSYMRKKDSLKNMLGEGPSTHKKNSLDKNMVNNSELNQIPPYKNVGSNVGVLDRRDTQLISGEESLLESDDDPQKEDELFEEDEDDLNDQEDDEEDLNDHEDEDDLNDHDDEDDLNDDTEKQNFDVYDSQQIYPKPNQGSSITNKRVTIDNPVQTFNNVKKIENEMNKSKSILGCQTTQINNNKINLKIIMMIQINIKDIKVKLLI